MVDSVRPARRSVSRSSLALLLLLAVLVTTAITMTVMRASRAEAHPSRAPDSAPVAHAASSRGAEVRSEGMVAAYPGADIPIATEIGGRVVKLAVAERSRVARGALLAEIDASDERARLEEARSQIAEADLGVHQLESETTRLEALVRDRAATAQTLERSTHDLAAARARRATLDATTRRLELAITRAEIRAPFAGTVTATYVAAGEVVAPNSKLLRLTDVSRLRIEAEIDEFDAARIRVGAPVTLRAEGYEGRTWRATVEEVPLVFSPRRLTPQDPGRSADGQVLIVKIAPSEQVPFWLGQRVDVSIAAADSSARPEGRP